MPYFGLGAISDPRRGDLVAGLGDATSEKQLLKIKSLLMESSTGRKLMREKPLITESSLQLSSSNFPEDSLGRKYCEFMKVNSLKFLEPFRTISLEPSSIAATIESFHNLNADFLSFADTFFYASIMISAPTNALSCDSSPTPTQLMSCAGIVRFMTSGMYLLIFRLRSWEKLL